MGLLHYLWSRTAASNATSDAQINWAEGQAPSSVNDSARAMMASLAGYRDDISGAIVTTGTSTAYTVTSYQVFDTLAHMANQVIAFTPHATNGATVTLNVDGLGAKPLRPSPSVELLAGTLILGTPYVAVYNNSDAVWYLQGFYGNPYNIPIGGLLPYAGQAAPNSSFVLAFGQLISSITYSTYNTIVGSTYGSGTNLIGVPDLRGRVPAGVDNMGGSAACRLTAASSMGTGLIGQVGGLESQTLTAAQIPAHTHSGTTGNDSPDHTHTTTGFLVSSGQTVAASGGAGVSGTASSVASAGASARHTHAFTTDNGTGGGAAHSNVQPTIVTNYIIRII